MSSELALSSESKTQLLEKLSLTERRALEFLGSGASPEQVAAAVGVSTSRISQLLADESFAAAVADLRFDSLAKHTTRDAKADSLEDQLLEKLENLLPMMFRPMEVVKAYATLNAAKRRGASAPTSISPTQTFVTITLPQIIVDRFTAVTTNVNNQVVKAGNQDLITMQSGALLESCKGEVDHEFVKRAENNAELEARAGAVDRATQLLLRAKSQVTGGQSRQSSQDIEASFVQLSS